MNNIHSINMSKFNASKWIDVLGLITTIIGLVSSFIDQVSNQKNKKKGGNNELHAEES